MGRLNFAVVCASNVNRSVTAHAALQEGGLQVSSFGVGAHVKLPGPSQREPNVYNFGTPYADILADLTNKDTDLYTRNGLLNMLKRNVGVKRAPERFQHSRVFFDVVVTFEMRVMEQVIEDLDHRTPTTMKPILVLNLDVKDSHEEAAIAAPHALRLCQELEAAPLWEDAVDDIVASFEQDTRLRAVYNICFA